MKKLILVPVILGLSVTLMAQPSTNIGVGLGIDYGGIGGRFTVMPAEKFGIFGALGYNLVGVGFNGGLNYKFNPGNKVCPVIGAMYGYNGVLKVEGGSESSDTYYGPSFSFGVEVKTRGNTGSFWNFEIVLPIRSSEFSDDVDNLKNYGYDVTEPWPIGISIGYHFGRL